MAQNYPANNWQTVKGI